MSICKIAADSVFPWVETLIGKQLVYGPVSSGGRFKYVQLKRARDLRLDFDVTLVSPKKFFLPQREVLIRFEKNQYESAMPGGEPFILFGVHPYDVAAIQQMDDVFQSDSYDVHYMERRKRATIVAVDVQNPSPNVFAACMNTAVAEDGFDVLLTLVGGTYVVDARTEKGEKLVECLQESEPADAVSLGRRDQVWSDARRFLKKHELKCAAEELPDLLERSYDHPVWEKRASMCYSCGSCNLVCPTCYCFDMQDDLDWDLGHGERRRIWDGCMLRDFAKVAGGHNFRKHRSERYRHRFYRKGQYMWRRFGQIACIGCGRCATACTTDIANPVEVYNALLEEKRP